MRSNRWSFVLILLLGVIALVVLGQQRRTAAKLRAEIVVLRAEASERASLEAEAQRLAVRQASFDELKRLQAERSAVVALRAEIETMRRRAEASARTAPERSATAPAPKVIAPSMKEVAVPANLWKNVGAGTPEAAFETALWAGVGGDIETLASLLTFEAEAGTKAEVIFANLPATMQQELGTPQRLIALLVAKDVPLGSARIWAQSGDPTDTKISVELLNPEGKAKRAQLPLRVEGENWRFIVSAKNVERYADKLRAPEGGQ